MAEGLEVYRAWKFGKNMKLYKGCFQASKPPNFQPSAVIEGGVKAVNFTLFPPSVFYYF